MVVMTHNPAALARCTESACPVRYPAGQADHPCGDHDTATYFDMAQKMAAACDLGDLLPGDLDAATPARCCPQPSR